jgi:hypothetical protein
VTNRLMSISSLQPLCESLLATAPSSNAFDL